MDPNTLAVWKNLETHLDIPLRKNMVDLLLEMARVRTTAPKKIAYWMLTTASCICNAIFEDDNPSPLLYFYFRALNNHYPHLLKQIARIYSNEIMDESIPVITDRDEFLGLLWAAGCTFANGELILRDDEIDITLEGLKRFHAIWKAPTRTCDDSNDNTQFLNQL